MYIHFNNKKNCSSSIIIDASMELSCNRSPSLPAPPPQISLTRLNQKSDRLWFDIEGIKRSNQRKSSECRSKAPSPSPRLNTGHLIEKNESPFIRDNKATKCDSYFYKITILIDEECLINFSFFSNK